jgi:hypothetical protein
MTVSIYNLQGKMIDTLYTGYQEAGSYELNWDASAQPSGIYFIHATVNNGEGVERFVEKCLLMK